MKRYIEGVSRDQGTLFPDHLEDWIGDENVVRVIDAFVDELDLRALGFELAETTGRPGYHPSVLRPRWSGGRSRSRRAYRAI